MLLRTLGPLKAMVALSLAAEEMSRAALVDGSASAGVAMVKASAHASSSLLSKVPSPRLCVYGAATATRKVRSSNLWINWTNQNPPGGHHNRRGRPFPDGLPDE